MAKFTETVTTSQDEAVDQYGVKTEQKVRDVKTEAMADGRSTATNIVWFIVGAIQILLGFRFVLKLLGANPSSGFVDFIYSVSGVLTAPFDNIFGVTTQETSNIQSVFEPSILVAAAVYALLGWGIVKLINVNRNN